MKPGMKERHLNERQMERRRIYEENASKIPIENMFYKDFPPPFISIIGPPKSGKSTLLRSILKYFTHKVVNEVRGPVTLLSSKSKRLSFFEGKADIHQFIDISKIADLVIFTVDACSGLEMETFEFLSLLVSHGLSKILCVVTHTDKKNNPRHLKMLKKRIWAEICPSIKFFYLGRVSSEVYTDADLSSLCRTLSVMKYRPIEWKCTHPHIIVDRVEGDSMFGYVRGGVIQNDADVHIPGLGDTKISSMEVTEDPVPVEGERRLSPKAKILYMPMMEIDGGEKKERDVVVFNMEDESIKLFKRSTKQMKIDANDQAAPEKEIPEEPENMPESTEAEEESSMELSELRELVSGRFQREAATEGELVEKFNARYTEKAPEGGNFLLSEKRRLEALMEKRQQLVIPGTARPGQYVRVTLEDKLLGDVDFAKLIILGAFLVSEKELTILQGKIKKHKWSRKKLKSNEPLIFSVGWKRFQSVPVFSIKDATRNRYLKYSADSMFTAVSFYGPVVPAGTGFSVYSEKTSFKILGFGTITDLSSNPGIVKKLKLIGYPDRIHHNTVFVKSMFTSDLEVLRFAGAALRTASGLRGEVKAPHGKNGEFRAGFEGEMLMSDIVTLRCFVPIDVHRIHVPVNNLFGEWRGLRPLYEIRQELGIRHPFEDSDSGYEEEVHELNVPEGSYGLPEELENELPLDKRTIKVISKRIELPVPPDAREEHERRRVLEELRRKRNEEEELDRARAHERQRREEKRNEKEKAERTRRAIHESYEETNKKYRRKKLKR
jgi:ribosome biogenesis protein BMS1